jgi:hypothetical protein
MSTSHGSLGSVLVRGIWQRAIRSASSGRCVASSTTRTSTSGWVSAKRSSARPSQPYTV